MLERLEEELMTRLIAPNPAAILLLLVLIACYGVVAQNQRKEKIDAAGLIDAPNVPQMVVDSDGALHFGPRTVPLPALSSPEARASYTRQMLRRAQTSAGRGGLASVRILEGNAPPPAADGSKEAALRIYPVMQESE